MPKKRLSTEGFSLIEALVIIVVLAVLSGASLFIYHHDTSKKIAKVSNSTQPATSNKTAPTTATTTPLSAPTTHYLDIKEWGVHLTLNNVTASLYYYINPKYPDFAYLSLKTVSDIAPYCAANDVSLGAISRLTEAEQQHVLANPTAGDIANEVPGKIHIGKYWYGYSNPQSGCIATTSQNVEISKVLPTFNRGSISAIFNTLAADPVPN